TAADASSPVAMYPITAAVGSLAAGNYDFTFVDGTLTVNRATLTVTADDKSREYGEPNPARTASFNGFKNGETLPTSGVTGSPSLTTVAGNTSAVGTYAITAALGSLASGNYAFTFANGSLSVTPRPVTATADPQSKTYGDGDPALTYLLSSGNLVNGD